MCRSAATLRGGFFYIKSPVFRQGLIPTLHLPHNRGIQSWLRCFYGLHEIINYFHCPFTVCSLCYFVKFRVALIPSYWVASKGIQWGFFFFSIQSIFDCKVRCQFDAGVCVRVALPLTFRYRFVQIFFFNQGYAPPLHVFHFSYNSLQFVSGLLIGHVVHHLTKLVGSRTTVTFHRIVAHVTATGIPSAPGIRTVTI